MSKPASRFGGLSATIREKSPAAAAVAEPEVVPDMAQTAEPRSSRTKGRSGKKMIAGFFSDDLSRQLRTIAATEGSTVQSLMGEAFDLLMRDRGKHPFGER